MLRPVLLAAVLVGGASVAFADEVVIHRDVPVDVVTPPPASEETVIEHRSSDCQTTRTRTDDEATGESTTVTRRSCD